MTKGAPSWGFSEGDEIVPGRHAFKLLGGGSLYEAYLSWDDHLACLVVVKILRPNSVSAETALSTLAREAEVLGRLNHPVVARSFAAVLDSDKPHLVLEYLEGSNLAALLTKGPLPLEQLLPLALHICSALHYLAEERLVHLDVKPANIVMGIPPRLIDFSVARSVDDARRIDREIGTDAYMAPEQCDPDERGEIGPATDVWGLGATLFHAVSGQKPFPQVPDFDRGKDELIARFPQLEFGAVALPDRTPPLLNQVIEACLEKDPADRPAATEVALALEPLVSVLPKRPVFGLLRPKLR